MLSSKSTSSLPSRLHGGADISNDSLSDDQNGTKCLADQSGVQETKYCGDGGVYYFNAWHSAENSYVTAPKGWDKLNKTEYNISIPVSDVRRSYEL